MLELPGAAETSAARREENPAPGPAPLHERRLRWAQLLLRVFATDALRCNRCGARIRILAAIDQAQAARAILDCLGFELLDTSRQEIDRLTQEGVFEWARI